MICLQFWNKLSCFQVVSSKLNNSATFFSEQKKKLFAEVMSYNFSEAAMREERGFPSSLRKILIEFFEGDHF